MILTLPWPDARLSPNARVHHHALARAKKTARMAAFVLTLEIGGIDELRAHFAGDFGIPIRLVFYPPDNHKRDLDNILASMKAALDGIADALKVNDNRFVPWMEMRLAHKPGRVEVIL